MENSLLRNESLQSEMLEVEEFFEELGFVYDTLAEKIADLKTVSYTHLTLPTNREV